MDFSYTYGVLPPREIFFAQCEKEDGDELSVDNFGFGFTRDPRMGTCRLNKYELWDEVLKASAEYDNGDDEAGDWVSSVLYCLDIEWV